jgi:hypothetical protein
MPLAELPRRAAVRAPEQPCEVVKSVYVRSPGGALFELAVTHAEGGWTCDESPKELGGAFQLPEQIEI